jgi:hypothetical protein
LGLSVTETSKANQFPQSVQADQANVGNDHGSVRQATGSVHNIAISKPSDSRLSEEVFNRVLDAKVRKPAQFALGNLSIEQFKAVVVAVEFHELVNRHRRRDQLGGHDSFYCLAGSTDDQRQ